MKMTMHIDDALLERVIRATGASSKTEAVSIALKEMDRRARLAEMGRSGIGLTKAEMVAAVDPSYDLMAMRVAESGGSSYASKKKSKSRTATKKQPKPKG